MGRSEMEILTGKPYSSGVLDALLGFFEARVTCHQVRISGSAPLSAFRRFVAPEYEIWYSSGHTLMPLTSSFALALALAQRLLREVRYDLAVGWLTLF